MTTDRLPNRWGIAVAAVIMQICLGAVYGWSVFVKPLIGTEHWTLTQVSLSFTLAIFFLGVGTVIGGLWQDRVGPRPGCDRGRHSLRHSATCRGALAASRHSLGGLYLGYGVLGRHRHGDGLHLPGCHPGEVVPGPARADDRRRGVRLRRWRAGHESDRRSRNRGAGRARYFPDLGNRVFGSRGDHRPVLPEPAAGLASGGLGAALLPSPRPPLPTTSR